MTTTTTKKAIESQARFIQQATNVSSKLTFNTREEYLNWVKQWKEDYKLILQEYVASKYHQRWSRCILPVKVDYYKKKMDAIPKFTSTQQHKLLDAKIRCLATVGADVNCTMWYPLGAYIKHMLIIRKAGKLRAAIKREERIAASKVVV